MRNFMKNLLVNPVRLLIWVLIFVIIWIDSHSLVSLVTSAMILIALAWFLSQVIPVNWTNKNQQKLVTGICITVLAMWILKAIGLFDHQILCIIIATCGILFGMRGYFKDLKNAPK